MNASSRRPRALVVVILAFPFLSSCLYACSCAPPPPPCEAIGQSELVFLGTVTDMRKNPGDLKRAQMRIDRVFKGTLKETVELFDDGMCDGPELEVGRQYLMYTHRFPTGEVPARGCSRSRGIEDAEEDLKFLEEYLTGKTKTHISGTVRFRPDEPQDSELGHEGRTPLKGVTVTLTHNGKETQATSDAMGVYTFPQLPPGEYEVDADLAGYHLDWAPEDIKLEAQGCVEANLLMKVDRRVEGIVRDDGGGPAKGIQIEMIRTDRKLKRWEQPILLTVSDEGGSYVLDGVPPGEYYLGVNINSTPTKDQPYPRIYYPDTTDIDKAIPITFVSGAAEQKFDLRVSGKLPLVEIQGRVLKANGEPPRVEEHPQVRIKEPGLYGQIEQESIEIDAEGRFHFELCTGVRYSAFAFVGPMQSTTYAAPVEFIPTKENNRLELVLDKTGEEFRKLSGAIRHRN